jgi:glycopeptide antibiotics resistance protein
MDIFKFIEKLQKKPEADRKKILLITVSVIMAIIIAVWLTTFKLEPAAANGENIISPLDSIKTDFKDFYGFFKSITK